MRNRSVNSLEPGTTNDDTLTGLERRFHSPNLTPAARYTVVPVASGFDISPPAVVVTNLAGLTPLVFIATPPADAQLAIAPDAT